MRWSVRVSYRMSCSAGGGRVIQKKKCMSRRFEVVVVGLHLDK